MPQKTQPIQAFKPAADASKMVAIGSGSYEEDPCVICHEDMNASFDIVTLECGHRYHSAVRFIILRCCEGIENRFLQIMMKALKGFAILFCPIKTPSGHGKLTLRLCSHDVTAAILVSQNNETAAILVYQTNPV